MEIINKDTIEKLKQIKELFKKLDIDDDYYENIDDVPSVPFSLGYTSYHICRGLGFIFKQKALSDIISAKCYTLENAEIIINNKLIK